MSYLKEIYEILQLHVCLNCVEITVFFRGGLLLFSYTSYKVYSTLWSSLCCSTLKLEIKTLDPKLFLMVTEMYMKVDNALWINFSSLNKQDVTSVL